MSADPNDLPAEILAMQGILDGSGAAASKAIETARKAAQQPPAPPTIDRQPVPRIEAELIRKRQDTARARTAMISGQLHIMVGDDGLPLLIATCGAWTQSFRSLEQVEAWLDQVKAPK